MRELDTSPKIHLARMGPNASKMDQKGINMEPTGSQSESRNIQKHHLQNRVDKVMKKRGISKIIWEPSLIKIYKNTIPNIIKKQSRKYTESYVNGARSMPTLIKKRCQNW